MRARATNVALLSALAAGAQFAVVARPAGAQTALSGTGTLGLIYTDNANNTPDRPAPGGTPRAGALVLALTPGVAFQHRATGVEYAAAYVHPYQFYLDSERPARESDLLSLRGNFALSERDQLTMSLLGSYSRTSDLLSIPSRRLSTAPTPLGSTRMVTTSANARFMRLLSETWTFGQHASAAYAVPVFDASSVPGHYTLSSGLSLGHRRVRDIYDFRGDVTYLGTSGSPPVPARAPVEWSGALSASWSHRISETVISSLNAGSVVALRNASVAVRPTLAGTLRRSGERSSETVTASRSMDPDVLTGSYFLSDAVRVSVIEILSLKARITGRATGGFSWNRAISAEATSKNVRVATAEVAFDWAVIPDALSASAAYQHLRQWGDTGAVVLGDLHRNQFMFIVSSTLPRIGLDGRGSRPFSGEATSRPLGGPSGATLAESPALFAPSASGTPSGTH